MGKSPRKHPQIIRYFKYNFQWDFLSLERTSSINTAWKFVREAVPERAYTHPGNSMGCHAQNMVIYKTVCGCLCSRRWTDDTLETELPFALFHDFLLSSGKGKYINFIHISFSFFSGCDLSHGALIKQSNTSQRWLSLWSFSWWGKRPKKQYHNDTSWGSGT